MPTEIPRDEEESDKDMQGLVDSSIDDDAHAQPDEREETVQVGDAKSAQFSTLAQALEASEEIPRIRHLSTPTLARSDLSTHVLIGGSGHSSIAEAPDPGDSDESSWASENYNGGRDDTSSSDSDGRVQPNELGSGPIK